MTSRTLLRRAAAIMITALAALALARASAVPWPTLRADAPRLRLSWSARPERIEVCHRLSDEELAAREVHMRQRVECEGSFATYALRVSVDDRALTEEVVRGGGLRHDRPMHLLHEVIAPAGAHRLRVELTRVEQLATGSDSSYAGLAQERADTGLFAGRAQREASEHARRAGVAIPAHLVLDTVVVFSRGRLALVTLDPDRHELMLVGR